MDRHKRERLEAAGWTIGNTADFLQLSPEENELIELKLATNQNSPSLYYLLRAMLFIKNTQYSYLDLVAVFLS